MEYIVDIIATIIKKILPEILSKWLLEKLHLKKTIKKEEAFILFIDDEIFPVIESLKSAGWNVGRLSDLTNFQDEFVKRAHVIFVDYKGVGTKLASNDEGLGVIKGLKEHYGNKKRVILYSAHTGFSLGKHLDWADGQFAKNSQVYEFISKIEEELEKIK